MLFLLLGEKYPYCAGCVTVFVVTGEDILHSL